MSNLRIAVNAFFASLRHDSDVLQNKAMAEVHAQMDHLHTYVKYLEDRVADLESELRINNIFPSRDPVKPVAPALSPEIIALGKPPEEAQPGKAEASPAPETVGGGDAPAPAQPPAADNASAESAGAPTPGPDQSEVNSSTQA